MQSTSKGNPGPEQAKSEMALGRCLVEGDPDAIVACSPQPPKSLWSFARNRNLASDGARGGAASHQRRAAPTSPDPSTPTDVLWRLARAQPGATRRTPDNSSTDRRFRIHFRQPRLPSRSWTFVASEGRISRSWTCPERYVPGAIQMTGDRKDAAAGRTSSHRTTGAARKTSRESQRRRTRSATDLANRAAFSALGFANEAGRNGGAACDHQP